MLFFFNDTATTEIYTLSLHDALPILLMVSRYREERAADPDMAGAIERTMASAGRTVAFSGLTVAISLAGLLVFPEDRESTRLNSSHANILYVGFCFEKKKTHYLYTPP